MNEPGSSWPDKLHSQRPFPSLGKQVCILRSPRRLWLIRVVRPSFLPLPLSLNNLQAKNNSQKCLHSSLMLCSPYFYLHNLRHTWKSAKQQRKRAEVVQTQVCGLWWFTTSNDVSKVLLERKTSAKPLGNRLHSEVFNRTVALIDLVDTQFSEMAATEVNCGKFSPFSQQSADPKRLLSYGLKFHTCKIIGGRYEMYFSSAHQECYKMVDPQELQEHCNRKWTLT